MNRSRLALVSLTGIVGAALSLAMSAPAATAQSVGLTYDLGVVLPGDTRTVERTIDVPVDAVIADADFSSRVGGAHWTSRLCGATGSCTAIDDLAGETLRAGSYRLMVELTMPRDATGSHTVAADGSITLVEATRSPAGGLPATGGTVPIAAGLLGGLLAAVGAVLLLARRRGEASS